MAGKTKLSGNWSRICKQMDAWDKPALLALVKDLCERDAANRDFVQARCQAGTDNGEILGKYRDKIKQLFVPASRLSHAKLRETCKAIRDYRKATGDISGTADLLLDYLEKGIVFSRGYGDSDERLIDNLSSVLDELATLLRNETPASYPLLRDRLAKLAKKTRNMGWGFGDIIATTVEELEAELGQR